MVNNIINLMEVIDLMKMVRKNTNIFINNLKESLYIEKDGKLINPKHVQIRYFNDYYLISIEGHSFILNEDGKAKSNVIGDFKDFEKESDEILNRNREIIQNALIHLHSDPYKYYMALSNIKGLMFYEGTYSGMKYAIRADKIILYSGNLDKIKAINYYAENDKITIETRKKEISLDTILKLSSNSIDGKTAHEMIENFLSNIYIDKEVLPLVLKKQLESESSKKSYNKR